MPQSSNESTPSRWQKYRLYDIVVVFILLAFVLVVAVVPYLIYFGSPLPGRAKFVEELDLILGPMIIAGSVGFCLEDWFIARRMGRIKS